MPEFTETTGQRTETRRTALKVLGGLVGVGTTSAVGLGAFTRRGSAAIDDGDFTAQDVTLESDDGTVTDIWLRPDLTYSWSGLNAPPSETAFVVEVTTPDGGVAELGSETDDEIVAGTSGSDAYTFANRLSLISDGPWSTSDFEPGSDGGTETFGPITVSVTAKLRNGDEDSPYVDSADAEFSVTVTDSAVRFGGDGSGHGIEGEAQTGGSTGGGQTDGGGNNVGGDDADGGNGGGGGDSGSDGNGGNGGNGNDGSGDRGTGGGPSGDQGGDGNGPPGDGGGPSDREGGGGWNR